MAWKYLNWFPLALDLKRLLEALEANQQSNTFLQPAQGDRAIRPGDAHSDKQTHLLPKAKTPESTSQTEFEQLLAEVNSTLTEACETFLPSFAQARLRSALKEVQDRYRRLYQSNALGVGHIKFNFSRRSQEPHVPIQASSPKNEAIAPSAFAFSSPHPDRGYFNNLSNVLIQPFNHSPNLIISNCSNVLCCLYSETCQNFKITSCHHIIIFAPYPSTLNNLFVSDCKNLLLFVSSSKQIRIHSSSNLICLINSPQYQDGISTTVSSSIIENSSAIKFSQHTLEECEQIGPRAVHDFSHVNVNQASPNIEFFDPSVYDVLLKPLFDYYYYSCGGEITPDFGGSAASCFVLPLPGFVVPTLSSVFP